MSGILQSRKADNLNARFLEHTRGEFVVDIINRAFEAGVAAHSDHMEASRQMAMDKARKQFEAQRNTEPVAIMDAVPGTLLSLWKEGK